MQNSNMARGVVRDRRSAILLPSPDSGFYPEATVHGVSNVTLAIGWIQRHISTGSFSFRKDTAHLCSGHPRNGGDGPVLPLSDLLNRRWTELTIEFVGDGVSYFDCFNEAADTHFSVCLLLSEGVDSFELAAAFKGELAVPGKEIL